MQTRRSLTAALAVVALAVPGVAAAGPSHGDALVFRAANGNLQILDPASARLVRTVSPGVLSADGTTLLTARVRHGSTALRRISLASGAVVERRTIPGAWGFQQAAADGTLVAGGDRGQPIALVAAGRTHGYRGGVRTTRIALVPADLAGPLRVLRFAGNLGVDDVGPDGHYLYLIQHVTDAHYRVRAYDLRAGRLLVAPVVDKREPDEKMQGLPLARATSVHGDWVMTLYRRPSGVPFVHALMATQLFAFCIDLPASARVDPADPSSWGVAVSGRRLFVANAETGFVAAVDYPGFELLRTASLGAQPATGGAPRPLAVSGDGSRLYLARPQGLVSIDAVSLGEGAALSDRAFGSLAMGSDGLLYATDAATTDVLDARTGDAKALAASTAGLTLVGVVRGR